MEKECCNFREAISTLRAQIGLFLQNSFGTFLFPVAAASLGGTVWGTGLEMNASGRKLFFPPSWLWQHPLVIPAPEKQSEKDQTSVAILWSGSEAGLSCLRPCLKRKKSKQINQPIHTEQKATKQAKHSLALSCLMTFLSCLALCKAARTS